MIGRVEHAGIVTARGARIAYATVIAAWNYDQPFRGTGGPGETSGLLPISSSGAMSDWSGSRPENGERAVWVTQWGMERVDTPRIWVLRAGGAVLAHESFAYGRPWEDELPERTERLLRWCCPRCGDPIVAGHECGLSGGTP